MAMQELTIKDGNGTNQTVNVHSVADGSVQMTHSTDGNLATYRAGNITATPVATPTAFLRIKGHATKTVRIRKIVLQGIATAAGNMECVVDKNSTTGTDNASTVWTAVTKAPLDSGNAAAGATVEVLTGANQDALGTTVGKLYAGRLQLSADGSGVAIIPLTIDFGVGGQQAVVLRSATENVTVGFNGDAVPSGGKIDYFVEWTEETEA